MAQVKRLIRLVSRIVTAEIAAFTQDNLYIRGMASEGYQGGYRDALYDVLLAMGGITPNRVGGWWEEARNELEKGKQHGPEKRKATEYQSKPAAQPA